MSHLKNLHEPDGNPREDRHDEWRRRHSSLLRTAARIVHGPRGRRTAPAIGNSSGSNSTELQRAPEQPEYPDDERDRNDRAAIVRVLPVRASRSASVAHLPPRLKLATRNLRPAHRKAWPWLIAVAIFISLAGFQGEGGELPRHARRFR
jgi:hypothetical protein